MSNSATAYAEAEYYLCRTTNNGVRFQSPKQHHQAEDAARDFALTQPDAGDVEPNSQRACRKIASIRLQSSTRNHRRDQSWVVWAPAHNGIPGNEVATIVALHLIRQEAIMKPSLSAFIYSHFKKWRSTVRDLLHNITPRSRPQIQEQAQNVPLSARKYITQP